MPAQVIKDEFDRFEEVRHLLLRSTQALVTQMCQTVVCNRLHIIDQQVCGLLLHCLDRVDGGNVAVTQELLASMLGVRRESISPVARRLQAQGAIRYARGHIAILDRGALERGACE